jgi:hypothetical protein
LFLCFEAVLELKINLTKSELVPVGFANNLECLAMILGYKVSFFAYEGLPTGAYFKTKFIWKGIIENVQRRLAGHYYKKAQCTC